MWVVNYELSYENYDIDNYRDDMIYDRETICFKSRQEVVDKLVEVVITTNGNEELSILNFRSKNHNKLYCPNKHFIEIETIMNPSNEPEITELDIKQHPSYIAKKAQYEATIQTLIKGAERGAKIYGLKQNINRLQNILDEFSSIEQIQTSLDKLKAELAELKG